MKIIISGTFCAVTIDKAMYKDSGDWHIIVGTGKSLAAFHKKEYVYPVLVSGSSDHKGVEQHLVDSGNDIIISQSSLTDVTFCRVDVPFFLVPLHITIPTDPRYIDNTSYENGRITLSQNDIRTCSVHISNVTLHIKMKEFGL